MVTVSAWFLDRAIVTLENTTIEGSFGVRNGIFSYGDKDLRLIDAKSLSRIVCVEF